MPIVTVHLLEGRDPETKKKLIKNVTHAVIDTLDVPPESVRIILDEMPPQNYGIAGLPIKDYRLKKIKAPKT